MTLLATFARYEIAVILAAFAAVVVYLFLTGHIKTQALLNEKTAAGTGAADHYGCGSTTGRLNWRSR